MQRTPSPVTPVSFAFDALAVPSKQHDPHIASFPQHPTFFAPPMKDSMPSTSLYPPIPQQSAATFAYPPAPHAHAQGPGPVYASAPQQQQQQQSQSQSQQSSSGDSRQPSTSTKLPGKKNQYPCPLAKQYNCNDYFTTSGHAARHAKKHTGKKDAFCPECNKAFTRKDNMEQHRRTHQNGRNSSAASSKPTGESASKRAKTSHSTPLPKSHSRPKPPPIQQAPTAQMVEASPISPASSFGFADSHSALTMQSVVPPAAVSQYPPELLQQSPYAHNSPYPVAAPYYDPANMSGLDKLAMAASGESPPLALESPPQPPSY